MTFLLNLTVGFLSLALTAGPLFAEEKAASGALKSESGTTAPNVVVPDAAVSGAAVVEATAPEVAKTPTATETSPKDMTIETFLDRLMMAESGGRLNLRNSRSTAVGPFQFIASTWLSVARKHFAEETRLMSAYGILKLRTDVTYARRAARIYTEQNAAFLVANGHKASYPHLRLAFLVGPTGARRVLAARPETKLVSILGATVIGANPFMAQMTAEDLIKRCAREIATDRSTVAGLEPNADAIKNAGSRQKSSAPTVAVACDLDRPSCRRWLALATKREARVTRLKQRSTKGKNSS